MIGYIIYNELTGEINNNIYCSADDLLLNIPEGYSHIEHAHADYNLYYIDIVTEEVIERPNQIITQDTDTIIANGVDKSIFSNVAIGSNVIAGKINFGVETEGITEVTFDLAGTYTVEFILFPYITERFIVNAG